MKNLHHQPQRQKLCWRLKGIVMIRPVFSSVSRRTLLVNKIVLLPSRPSSSSTHQFSDVLPSPLMPMIGFVPSSESLRPLMLLPVIVCSSQHIFGRCCSSVVGEFHGNETSRSRGDLARVL